MTTLCLIGEADPFIASLLRRFGEESGLQTVRARVGQEVLVLAQQIRPAIVIVDAELPGEMRGWEAVQALQADSELCQIPIVACSWLPEADARTMVGQVAGYLQKPDLHYEDFLAALAKAGLEIGPHVAEVNPAAEVPELD